MKARGSGSSESTSDERSPSPGDAPPSTILQRWGITEQDLTVLVDENPSLRGIMLGYAAEHKLRELIERHPKVSKSRKYDDHDRSRKSDRVISFEGHDFSIEVKSLQTNSIRRDGNRYLGKSQVDGSDRRVITFADGSELNTTLLLRGQFDILAVNCFAFRGQWDFVFALNRDLPTSTFKKYSAEQQRQLIASLVPVTWPPEAPFVSDPFPLVQRLLHERKRGAKGTSA